MPEKPVAETRARLIQAATEVFAAKGFEKATVREICRRARVNVALVKYYFGDKLELYTEVLRASLTPPPVVVDDESPEAALRRLIRVMLERAAGAKGATDLRFRLMLNEFVRPSIATARVVDVVMRPVYDRLRDLLSEVSGLSRDHQRVRLCAHGILGQVAHFSKAGPVLPLLWPGMTMKPDQRDLVAQYVAEAALSVLTSTRGSVIARA